MSTTAIPKELIGIVDLELGKKVRTYDLEVDRDADDRATEFKLYSFKQPHMRGFHWSWISFMTAFIAWFSVAPIAPFIADTLKLTKVQNWQANICAVSSTVVTRFIVGPLCDMYGPKVVMCGTLLIGAIPVALVGTVQNFGQYCAARFFVGFIGGSFVMCQYWTSNMFAKNVVGTANAFAGGWGNLGGGIALLFMGSAIYPLCQIIFKNDETAWRTCFIVPAVMCIVVGIATYFASVDCPHGDFKDLKKEDKLPPTKPFTSFFYGVRNPNTLILCLHYACCFGVELTMNNSLTAYFMAAPFKQSASTAAAIASSYGFMNIIARACGGMISDFMDRRIGLRGRLIVHFLSLVLEGIMILVFAAQTDLNNAIVALVFFGFFSFTTCGTTYGIVPFVDPPNYGAVTGVSGAGGSLGAICWGMLFLYAPTTLYAMNTLGYTVLVCSVMTFFIRIPGHAMLVGGKDEPEKVVLNSRASFASCPSRNSSTENLNSKNSKNGKLALVKVTMNDTVPAEPVYVEKMEFSAPRDLPPK